MKELFDKLLNLVKKNKWAVVFLLALSSINETFPTSYDIYILINDYFSIAIAIGLGILFYIQKRKISLLMIILLTIEAWWFITTAINYSFSTEICLKTLIDMSRAISLGLIVEFFMDDPKALISGLLLNFEVAIYSYFSSILLGQIEPEKTPHPLLCTLIIWIIPAVMLALLHMIINKRYFRPTVMLIVCTYIIIDVWSATSVVAYAGFVGLTILGFGLLKMNKTKNFILPLWAFILLAIAMNLFILFVFTGKADKYPVITFFIEKVLHKSTNFTGRDVIWIEAIRLIKERPIIGYGFKPSLNVVQSAVPRVYSHCHNQLLQRLCATGVIGLIQFAIFHFELIRKIDSGKNTYARIVAMAAVFAVSITYIAEAYKKFFIFYAVYFVAYHVEELVDNAGEQTSLFSRYLKK